MNTNITRILKSIAPAVIIVVSILVLWILWKTKVWATLTTIESLSDLPPLWYYTLVAATVILSLAGLLRILWAILWAFPKWQVKQLQQIQQTKVLLKTNQEFFSLENEARRTIAQIVGGFLVIGTLTLTGIQLIVTTNLNQEGQITDRFTKAISQLGDSKLEVRLGGIYALERIARDSEKDHWTIMEVLTAYVRENASLTKYKQANRAKEAVEQKLPTDIQAILTIIGRRPKRDEPNLLDLKRTFLAEATLTEAYLSTAKLDGADLQGANLIWANLEGASLSGAILLQADLSGARNVTWEQVSKAKIYFDTKLPSAIEEEHKEELKQMREKSKI